ncbi:MAG: MBOAT family protein [Acidobacteria bacterium]|nr:MBOAT family protein [Acidobacteriota bacterium]
MLFNSIAFAIFLPLVLSVYFTLKTRAQNFWLLLASLVFYGWWDPRFLLLLIVPTVIDYLCALQIHRAAEPKRKKSYLLFSVCTNLTILGFFKYFNFFIGSTDTLLNAIGVHHALPTLSIILPVGISFYTFHELSYVIDVYREDLEPVSDFWLYVLYVLYFPQLVAGPIARAANLLPQLARPRRVNWQLVREGLLLILIGFFKKVGVADALGPVVDFRFLNPASCSGFDLLVALYLFSVQIYCDFSGYTDIARGVSKLFGIELLINFNRPYFAASITDFWHRWHISLSTWLRDYLYIPLGGNRDAVAKTYRNLMLTMLLGGLWHGASWTFVVWGGLHGLYLAAHKFLLDRTPIKSESLPTSLLDKFVLLLKVVATFHLVALTWIFFRAESFGMAWKYLYGILTWHPATANSPASLLGLRITALCVGIFALDIAQEFSHDEVFILKQRWFVRGVCYASLIILILIFGGLGANIPFIYFQF